MDLEIQNLQDKAINKALEGKWEEAIELNKKIIDLQPQDVDAYLAIGFAYMQTFAYKEAEAHYKKALKIEPGNPIAHNNLDKIKILKSKKAGKRKQKRKGLEFDDFINVVGKTKVVELVNIGQAEILAKLEVGEQVFLKQKKRRLELRTEQGDYIGALPDDISKRLIFFIGAKSVYNVFIKSAIKNCVEVFIQEKKKGAAVKKFISFPQNIKDDLKSMIKQVHYDEEDKADDPDENKEKEDGEEDETHPIEIDSLADSIGEKQDSFISEIANYEDDEDEEE